MRIGIRMMELKSPERLEAALDRALPFKNSLLQKVYGHPGFTKGELMEEYLQYAETLTPFITDTSLLLHQRKNGLSILMEEPRAPFWISTTVPIPLSPPPTPPRAGQHREQE